MKKRMSSNRMKLFGFFLLICVVIFFYKFMTTPREVADAVLIEETLETASDENYTRTKDEFKKLIEEYYNCSPEKVVFFISAPSDPWCFQVELYYRDNSTWYYVQLSWLSRKINNELGQQLVDIIFYSSSSALQKEMNF